METERTLKAGFAGIGELAMYHGGWTLADFEALSPSLELAESAGVPVVIHVNEPVGHHYPGKIPVDFRGLVRIIKANPDVTFILAHFGGGIFIYGLMPEIGRIFARTYVDTAASPFLYDAKVFQIACQIMGPNKVLFGSDYPLLPLSRYIKQLDASGINGSLRNAILGENVLEIIARNKKHAF
jgi:predicted TIM-barrel fold metal-dependent hydrolase